jgi:hypothetical protein
MKILFALTFLVLMSACSVLREFSTEGFTIEGNIVSYNAVPMAELTAVEIGLDNKKIVQELSFSLLHGSSNDKINNLLAFLHEKHPKYEIELNIPFEHQESFK